MRGPKGLVLEMTGAPEEEGRGLGTETEKDASLDLTAERGQRDLTAETADKIVLTGLLTARIRRGGHMREEKRDLCHPAPGDTLLHPQVGATEQGGQGQEGGIPQVRVMTE